MKLLAKELGLFRVYMDANGDKENGNEAKVDDCVNQYRHPTRLHVSELHHSALAGQLK